MERIDHYTQETIDAAMKLLDSNMEMLHVMPRDETRCAYCGKWREHLRFDEECPALLRCALTEITKKSRAVKPFQSCGICGGRMIEVRGRHPQDDDCLICPTCAVERLEQVRVISDREYGVAKASPLIRLSSEASEPDIHQAPIVRDEQDAQFEEELRQQDEDERLRLDLNL